MAKLIRATPILKGKDAELFLRRMIYMEKARINKTDKKLAEEIKQDKVFFKIA